MVQIGTIPNLLNIVYFNKFKYLRSRNPALLLRVLDSGSLNRLRNFLLSNVENKVIRILNYRALRPKADIPVIRIESDIHCVTAWMPVLYRPMQESEI